MLSAYGPSTKRWHKSQYDYVKKKDKIAFLEKSAKSKYKLRLKPGCGAETKLFKPFEMSFCLWHGKKKYHQRWSGGSTALFAAYTVDNVYTVYTDLRFVKKFTQPDLSAKNFTH